MDRSNGQQASVRFSRMWQFHGRAVGIMPSIGVVWQSSNFINYYYGVTPEEALPGRPPFSSHSAVNFRSSLLGYLFVSHRIRFLAYVEVQRLDNKIYQAPSWRIGEASSGSSDDLPVGKALATSTLNCPRPSPCAP